MPTANEYATTLYNQSSAAQAPGMGLSQNIRNAGIIGPSAYRAAGGKLQAQGYANLLEMLQNQGRMDPRILARQQALNSMFTQRQQGMAARNNAGIGGGGLSEALQRSISQAGQSRDQNLRYQDIADSYARNQQNLGILNQNVIQPGLQYSGVGNTNNNINTARKDQQASGIVSAVGNLIGSFI